jgi:hypothetical protein
MTKTIRTGAPAFRACLGQCPPLATVLCIAVLFINIVFLLPASSAPLKYILDTDIASDCDDAGALAMVNGLADLGELELLAVMVSTGGPYGAPAVSAINHWYGRSYVPIGTLKEDGFWVGGSKDAPAGALNYESYNHHLAENYPTTITSGTAAPDARPLYRRILAQQPDGSVLINTIGPLINLVHLMETGPDDHSAATGMELIRAKVRLLVIAGGRNPEGTSSNFSKQGAGPYAKKVIDEWPTRIVFAGNDIGGSILTGWSRNREGTEGNPARTAYRLFHGGDPLKKRPSWDQAAVLFAIRGLGEVYELVEDGQMTCTPQGQNRWVAGKAAGKQHAYVRKLENTDARIAETIEELMTREPLQR